MITREQLQSLTTMTADTLTEALARRDTIISAEFLGISNGGEFCYTAVKLQEPQPVTCKIWVRYDPAQCKVFVDY
jgi:hypothetical protein